MQNEVSQPWIRYNGCRKPPPCVKKIFNTIEAASFKMRYPLLFLFSALLLSAAPLPDPAQLDTQWWQGFQASGSELNDHINATVASLKKLQESEDQETIALIHRIIVNLRALPIAREERLAPPPIAPLPRPTYTLDQYLQLGVKERQAQNQVAEDQREMDRLSSASRNSAHSVAALSTDYLVNQNHSASERLHLGLEIMAQQSALAITQESLRAAQHRMEIDEIVLAHLTSERQMAASRLDLSHDNSVELERDLSTARSHFTRAQDDTARAEANAMATFDETPMGRALAALVAQQLITAKAQMSAASLSILYFEIQRTLAGQMQLPLEEVENQQDRARHDLSEWEKATLTEQERAHTAYERFLQEPTTAKDTNLQKLLTQRLLEVQKTLGVLQVVDNELYLNNLLIKVANSLASERWWSNLAGKAVAILIVAGALGVGIGLGLQDLVYNFFAGMIVRLGRTIRVGDIVELEDGQRAKVISIHIQNSTLRTFDGVDLIVPNLRLSTKRPIKWKSLKQLDKIC